VFNKCHHLLLPTAVALEGIHRVACVYEDYADAIGDNSDSNFYIDQDINLLNDKQIRGKYLEMYEELMGGRR
jgi:hypothetical protein